MPSPALRPVAALAVLALAGAGCASLSAYQSRVSNVKAGMEAWRYPQPVELIWPEVQRLLSDRGLDLAGSDAVAVGQSHGAVTKFALAARQTRSTPTGGLMLETGWDQNGIRWRAIAEPASGGVKVIFERIELNRDDWGQDGTTLRDYQLEHDLLRRIDVEAAERIEDGKPPAPAARPPGPPAAPPAPSPVGPPA